MCLGMVEVWGFGQTQLTVGAALQKALNTTKVPGGEVERIHVCDALFQSIDSNEDQVMTLDEWLDRAPLRIIDHLEAHALYEQRWENQIDQNVGTNFKAKRLRARPLVRRQCYPLYPWSDDGAYSICVIIYNWCVNYEWPCALNCVYQSQVLRNLTTHTFGAVFSQDDLLIYYNYLLSFFTLGTSFRDQDCCLVHCCAVLMARH